MDDSGLSSDKNGWFCMYYPSSCNADSVDPDQLASSDIHCCWHTASETIHGYRNRKNYDIEVAGPSKEI